MLNNVEPDFAIYQLGMWCAFCSLFFFVRFAVALLARAGRTWSAGGHGTGVVEGVCQWQPMWFPIHRTYHDLYWRWLQTISRKQFTIIHYPSIYPVNAWVIALHWGIIETVGHGAVKIRLRGRGSKPGSRIQELVSLMFVCWKSFKTFLMSVETVSIKPKLRQIYPSSHNHGSEKWIKMA